MTQLNLSPCVCPSELKIMGCREPEAHVSGIPKGQRVEGVLMRDSFLKWD